MRFEGFAAERYIDLSGNATIGYGHKLKRGEAYSVVSEDEAEVLLREDADVAEQAIHSHVTITLSQQQYDALVSFVFNIGTAAFASSTLLKLLNAGDYSAAGNEFLHWNKIRQNGTWVECAGLTARRAAELVLFREKPL